MRMGRQIQIAATPVDEKAFLEFLRQEADFILLESHAPTIAQLYKVSFEKVFRDHFQYQIWNRAFPWEPQYGQVQENPYNPDKIGWYYMRNKGAAPLIEFNRTNIDRPQFGRIYWSKYFSAPNGLDYDVEAFTKWFDKVIRWVRKNSAGKITTSWVTWFLPDAWRSHNTKP